ncbi:MAG: hypothetical protein A3B25_00675 [Candidatus Ryanbacteria bacterium RIFCSPLOWO2_01_FULL_48_26]|uniref:Uncharacterized protein n=1 Tax=Candidatus Ryanbacteria bacterium RIFCSPLOWO2_01_FULL_48_26 TaxID=1802126 RepID=A0A1G2GWL1_9BACT|nr:MAG: hypothetical protein A3B25_00675 [Candidatus Ryanbacteria bacterium RIFCSPLOWO2_01_FULL_48_26]
MKKISTDSYAAAFVAVLEKSRNADTVVKNFIETIKKNNDWAKRRQIREACEKEWRKVHGKSLVVIESARELNGEQRARVSKQWKDKGHSVEYKIYPSLIAGVKIVIDEEKQFDGSLNNKLRKVFASS